MLVEWLKTAYLNSNSCWETVSTNMSLTYHKRRNEIKKGIDATSDILERYPWLQDRNQVIFVILVLFLFLVRLKGILLIFISNCTN